MKLLKLLCLMWMVRFYNDGSGDEWIAEKKGTHMVVPNRITINGVEVWEWQNICSENLADSHFHKDKESARRCVSKTLGKEGKEWKEEIK